MGPGRVEVESPEHPRPRTLDWGSTPEERQATLPGDDLVPDATTVTTRFLTIRAPAYAVLPWVVQMGQDRAGFNTHNWVERVLQSRIPDVHEVRPEWQQLAPGDLMRTNRDIGGKPMGWPVLAIDHARSIVMQSRSMPIGTYAFILEPIDETSTRFLVRDRAAWSRREWLFKMLDYEPLHAWMEMGLLRGFRQRAEGRSSTSA